MGSCIICGTSVEGRICEVHQQDVVFEFRGTRPDELTPGRFYRGTVDGYADFGVFVDIGDQVTGLLHRSELDVRLDSLDWEPSDTVFVQVQNVRDNGDIDLGWSIRQAESEFRGTLVDDPDAETEYLADEDDQDTAEAEAGNANRGTTEASSPGATAADDDGDTGQSDGEPVAASAGGAGGAGASADVAEAERAGDGEAGTTTEAERPSFEQVTVDALEEHVGERVRLEGEIATARQTSGPTVFEVRDETGTVDCAAFEEAGVRVYPEAEEGDIVRLEGEVERRRGELQVETEGLVVLEDEEQAAVTDRMDEAMLQRARPEELEPLAPDRAVETALEGLRDAATAVRRAVLEGRPVVVRHSATADGYLAGVAIEQATLPLIREHDPRADAPYHGFDRRPLEGSVYGMEDATGDVTDMLSARDRHGEQLPLFVFVAAGATAESRDGLDLLGVYGARRVLVAEETDDAVAEAADVVASADGGSTTATSLAATLAVGVNGDARPELRHLPAASYWTDLPAAYLDLAREAGYEPEDLARAREAVALEAYYQSYEDKRQLIADLLYDEADGDLVEHVSEQFRERMDAEVETAESNLDRERVDGETVLVLDTGVYTHRYEFPPDRLLLDELYRRHADEAAALVGVGTDEAFVRPTGLDIHGLVEQASEAAPQAGLDARGAREGRIDFLSGERDAVREALVGALSER